jgi:ribonuclease III
MTSADGLAILLLCQQKIGYTFSRPELLRAALTHSSSATCERLFERFPDYQEGDLTKIKSVIVSRKTCAQFCRELDLAGCLFIGKGGFGSNAELPGNVLADLFEALVAAIFLDGGWEPSREFVRRLIEPEVEKGDMHALNANAKSEWQTVSQKEFGGTPRYYVLDEQGPDHDKCFKVAADVNGHRFPPAWGRNKKEAEIKAALNALAVYQNREVPYPC